jgi:hypothetical protein
LSGGEQVENWSHIQNIINLGLWTGVILHEMGQVLGMGTLWWYNDLQSDKGREGIKDDEYKGKIAREKWQDIGCSGDVGARTASARCSTICHPGNVQRSEEQEIT